MEQEGRRFKSSEGSAKPPHVGAFSFRRTNSLSNMHRVWSRLWSFAAPGRDNRRQPLRVRSRAMVDRGF
jgi:hypothetical protein